MAHRGAARVEEVGLHRVVARLRLPDEEGLLQLAQVRVLKVVLKERVAALVPVSGGGRPVAHLGSAGGGRARVAGAGASGAGGGSLEAAQAEVIHIVFELFDAVFIIWVD